MHIAIVLWGFTAILGKAIQLDEGLLVWYRMFISAAAIGIYLVAKNRFEKISWKQLGHLSLIGFIITLHWITFYGAIKASNVSVAIVCFSSLSLFTSILEPLSKKKRPKRTELLLSLIAMLGIYYIFSVQQLYYKGILLSLVSALLAAIFSIMNKNISNKVNPGTITFYELGTGFLLLTLLLPLWFTIHQSSFQLPSTMDLIYLLILGILCTTVAFTLSLYALQKIDTFTMNLSLNLEPIYSIVLAIIIFKEHELLGIQFYIGSLIIFSSIVVHGLLLMKERLRRVGVMLVVRC
ncbi:MAG: EamA family transporter [Bacteroidetes bacterium]|nr:EamA family transporter [Bacteroidota bacterium]